MKGVCVAKATRVGVALAFGLFALGAASGADAASEVFVGGYHDAALRAAQRTLMQDSGESSPEVAVGGIRISVDADGASAMTDFTPRFGGLAVPRVGAIGPDGGVAPGVGFDGSDAEIARRGFRLGPQAGTEIVGLEVNWAAIAEVGENESGLVADRSGMLVGGVLALSGVRLDAAVGHETDLLGLEGNRVRAGVGYDFGAIDARMSYSLVEGETDADTRLFTLGSQLTLKPGLIVQGDLAYAEGDQGEPATAGLLSLRLSF